MSNRDIDAPTFEEIGRRLTLVRRVLGLSQVQIAELMNLKNSRWNNWEMGVNQIPPNEALKLKRMLPGLSTDWIYDGDSSRLSVDVAKQLDNAAASNEEPVKRRGRPVIRQ